MRPAPCVLHVLCHTLGEVEILYGGWVICDGKSLNHVKPSHGSVGSFKSGVIFCEKDYHKHTPNHRKRDPFCPGVGVRQKCLKINADQFAGVCMRQVDDLHKTFIGSGWLQQQCANFNTEHELLVGILGMGSIMHHDHFQITASQVCSSQAKPQIYQIRWSEKFSTYLGRGGLQRQHVCFSGSRSAAARCSCLAGKQRR